MKEVINKIIFAFGFIAGISTEKWAYGANRDRNCLVLVPPQGTVESPRLEGEGYLVILGTVSLRDIFSNL